MQMLFKLIIFFIVALSPLITSAQCAMCRTQIVNNVSHGETSFAAGLNFGIIYLFVTPYIVVGIVAYLWFRNAKVNEKEKRLTGRIAG